MDAAAACDAGRAFIAEQVAREKRSLLPSEDVPFRRWLRFWLETNFVARVGAADAPIVRAKLALALQDALGA